MRLGQRATVDGGHSGGIKQLASLAAGQCCESHGREGSTVSGGSDLTDARDVLGSAELQRCGDDADRVDAGRLA